jgi:asparagine synthase (glutamine-hydrolysing)
MHFSREVRQPFLDHRLVEFALSLTDESLFHRGESKRVLRAAMRGMVPDVILDRRDKVGFATPWASWWTGSAGVALGEVLCQAERDLASYIEPGKVRPGTSAAFSLIGLSRAKALMQAA